MRRVSDALYRNEDVNAGNVSLSIDGDRDWLEM